MNKSTTANPRVYRLDKYFNTKCSKCNLSNKMSIGGHTFGNISDIELLIVAAYPARHEIRQGYSLAPNPLKSNLTKPNAGRYLESCITALFDLDPAFPSSLKPFYKHIAFTNIIKCSPFTKSGDKIDVKDLNIKVCKTWLEREIEIIHKYNPTCPILLCGTEASKLIHPKMTIYSNRRKQYFYKETHPVILSFNPVEAVRMTAYEISISDRNKKGRLIVHDVKPEKPVILGSLSWHWRKDLHSIKDLVLSNYSLRLPTSDFKKLIDYYS